MIVRHILDLPTFVESELYEVVPVKQRPGGEHDLTGDISKEEFLRKARALEREKLVHLSTAQKIYFFFEEPTSKMARIVSFVLIVMIMLSTLTYILSNTTKWRDVQVPSFEAIEILTVVFFTIDYFARLLTASSISSLYWLKASSNTDLVLTSIGNYHKSLLDTATGTGNTNNDNGTVHVSTYYNTGDGELVVTVHGCKKLRSADRNGLSDPYVRVGLKPRGQTKWKKSTIKKRTMSPTWEETFRFPVSLSELRNGRRILVIKVFDWDLAGSDDFLGQYHANLSDVITGKSPPLEDFSERFPLTDLNFTTWEEQLFNARKRYQHKHLSKWERTYRFALKPLNLIDLFSIVPFYIEVRNINALFKIHYVITMPSFYSLFLSFSYFLSLCNRLF